MKPFDQKFIENPDFRKCVWQYKILNKPEDGGTSPGFNKHQIKSLFIP